MANAYKAFYGKVQDVQTGEYLIDHSALIYLLAGTGRSRIYAAADGARPSDRNPAQISHALTPSCSTISPDYTAWMPRGPTPQKNTVGMLCIHVPKKHGGCDASTPCASFICQAGATSRRSPSTKRTGWMHRIRPVFFSGRGCIASTPCSLGRGCLASTPCSPGRSLSRTRRQGVRYLRRISIRWSGAVCGGMNPRYFPSLPSR